MRKIMFSVLFLIPSAVFANGWDFRLGLAAFPGQSTLVGLEVTRVFNLTEDAELGLGGVVRTDFNDTIGPGAVARFKYWLEEHFALGAVGEVGYILHDSTSNPNSYSYVFAGPVLAVRIRPIFVQWEPGLLFYQGTNKFEPFRIVFGIFF